MRGAFGWLVLWTAAFWLFLLLCVGAYLGHAQTDEAAVLAHRLARPAPDGRGGRSAGAILRSGARVFLGWGPNEERRLPGAHER